MKAKLFRVVMVLTALAATGLADFPLDLLSPPKCC